MGKDMLRETQHIFTFLGLPMIAIENNLMIAIE
jgi:hypothetical protein